MEDLRIVIEAKELYDEQSNRFYKVERQELILRHSLKSITMWESVYKVPFLEKYGTKDMTVKAVLDYIAFMVIEPKTFLWYYQEHPEVLTGLTEKDLIDIREYISDPMTATIFNDKALKRMGASSSKKEIVTSEIIYYWLVALEIPFEAENWNLNRLLALVRVCSIKNAPGKNMSKKDILASNKSLNAMRRAKLGSKG